MFDRLRHGLTRLLAAVLLITISTHAAVPAAAFDHARGSAFSASTSDVAVLAASGLSERSAMVQPEPTGPPAGRLPEFKLPVRPSGTASFRLPLWPQAPPLRPIRSRPAQPRAPPAD